MPFRFIFLNLTSVLNTLSQHIEFIGTDETQLVDPQHGPLTLHRGRYQWIRGKHPASPSSILPPPPPTPPPTLVGAGRGGYQGASLGLVVLGLGPGLGMAEELGIFSPSPLRIQPTTMMTTTMFSGVFDGGNYPMSLPNFWYLNPPTPRCRY